MTSRFVSRGSETLQIERRRRSRRRRWQRRRRIKVRDRDEGNRVNGKKCLEISEKEEVCRYRWNSKTKDQI